MQRIQTLSPQVANLIAAGEVVERPASVVKELLENAIDAGATRVTVEIEAGGTRLMRVSDNGCGMSPDDAVACFGRHATSKLRSESDLAAVATLGFRGEALASVAAVSRVTLRTREPGSDEGFEVVMQGGELVSSSPCGCPVGTDIAVQDLFYNTPARKKFLKKESTEAAVIGGLLEKLALSRPGLALSYKKDGRESLRTPGTGDLRKTAGAVLGQSVAGAMLPVSFSAGGMTVHGLCSVPEAARPRQAAADLLRGRALRPLPGAAVCAGGGLPGLFAGGALPCLRALCGAAPQPGGRQRPPAENRSQIRRRARRLRLRVGGGVAGAARARPAARHAAAGGKGVLRLPLPAGRAAPFRKRRLLRRPLPRRKAKRQGHTASRPLPCHGPSGRRGLFPKPLAAHPPSPARQHRHRGLRLAVLRRQGHGPAPGAAGSLRRRRRAGGKPRPPHRLGSLGRPCAGYGRRGGRGGRPFQSPRQSSPRRTALWRSPTRRRRALRQALPRRSLLFPMPVRRFSRSLCSSPSAWWASSFAPILWRS